LFSYRRAALAVASFALVPVSPAGAHASYAKVNIRNGNPVQAELINNNGLVAGEYGSGISGRAFIKAPDGSHTDFAVDGSVVTLPRGLTDAGAVGGRYDLPDDTIHGFFRDASGVLTPFDGPGLGAAEINGMNANNDIVGTYFIDAHQNLGGFIRHQDGTFTLFRIKGAYPGSLHLAGINGKGEIAGYYSDANFVSHGFLRKANGRIVTFYIGQSTTASAINDKGWIAGFHDKMQGYLRKPDGTVETIAPPGQIIAITAMNNNGDVTGCYAANFRNHGFIRKASGKMVAFDLPWGDTENMCAQDINDAGQVAGYVHYGSFGETEFGFVRTP